MVLRPLLTALSCLLANYCLVAVAAVDLSQLLTHSSSDNDESSRLLQSTSSCQAERGLFEECFELEAVKCGEGLTGCGAVTYCSELDQSVLDAVDEQTTCAELAVYFRALLNGCPLCNSADLALKRCALEDGCGCFSMAGGCVYSDGSADPGASGNHAIISFGLVSTIFVATMALLW